jgi:hypothetical protein
MANFKVHVLVAATVSGMASVGVTAVGMASIENVWQYFLLGLAGGLLPDIDSEQSTPTKIFFALFSLLGAFWVTLRLLSDYSFVELILLWLVTFAFFRYIIFEAFSRLTSHRGVFHSILASFFFGLIATNISYHLLQGSTLTSWMNGCFMTMGYLVHLSLDECYSVDLMNNRFKKSFGTALKVISLKNIKASLFMMGLTISLYTVSPNPHAFILRVDTMINQYSKQSKWLPKNDQWFSGLPRRLLDSTSS